MSILNATYVICKNIKKHPVRNDIKSLIKLLNASSIQDGNVKEIDLNSDILLETEI